MENRSEIVCFKLTADEKAKLVEFTNSLPYSPPMSVVVRRAIFNHIALESKRELAK